MSSREKRFHSTRSAALALCCAPLTLWGCSTNDAAESESVGVATQAIASTDSGAACGYSVDTEVKSVKKKSFRARITVTAANGGHLAPATAFTVLVRAGAAKLVDVDHGTFEAAENGYVLSTIPERGRHDCRHDDQPPEPLSGRAYRFDLTFEGPYTELVANIMSASGVACDQTAPTVQLATSGDFFTSNGVLTLSATATDDVEVAKVVFLQDGVEIGTDRTAPYSLAVPVSSALNGRHRYTAAAYDLTENQASSETRRVFVAIGNKFFGTATTIAADYTNLLAHFDQVTPGNAGKWGSVEAVRDVMNFTDLDTAYHFAKDHHLPFKLHTLVWGAQQPAWIAALPPEEQRAEIEQWMSALAERYPDIDMIDVVNEPLHAPPPYLAALGGAGATGWDWVVTSFQMARSHFPNSELLLNDFAILSRASSTEDYLEIVRLLKDRGLIDGVSEQAHFYERAPDLPVLTTNLNALAATGLPLYISELDLNLADDAFQANRMRDLFTTFWTHPSVVGITHWGYLQSNVWQPNIYLIRNDGSLRPALTFIDCFRAGGTDCPVPPYVPPPHTGDANGLTLQAEEYDSFHDLLPAGNVVAFANDGSWFGYSKVVFQDTWNGLKVNYANGLPGAITLTFHLDSVDSPPVASLPLPPTGSFGTFKTVSMPWTPLAARRDLFVRFNGGGANVDFVEFAAPPPPTHNIVANGTFESGVSGWFTFNGGVLSASTTRAHSGTQSLLVSNRTLNAPAATDLTSVVTPGKSYPFSLWASISSADGLAKAINVTQATSCRAADGTVSTTFTRIAPATNVPADGTWVQFTGTVAVPNCTLTQLLMWAEGATGPDLYVDDVEVLDTGAAPANLIPDGTFEAGQGAWFGFGLTTMGIDSTTFHSGAQSLKGGGMQPNGALARDIRALVQPGKRYTATAWVSVANRPGGAGLAKWQTIRNCNADASDSFPGMAFPTVTNGSWVQVTGTIDLTACTTINKLILFAGADAGDLFLDDVSLTPLP